MQTTFKSIQVTAKRNRIESILDA